MFAQHNVDLPSAFDVESIIIAGSGFDERFYTVPATSMWTRVLVLGLQYLTGKYLPIANRVDIPITPRYYSRRISNIRPHTDTRVTKSRYPKLIKKHSKRMPHQTLHWGPSAWRPGSLASRLDR